MSTSSIYLAKVSKSSSNNNASSFITTIHDTTFPFLQSASSLIRFPASSASTTPYPLETSLSLIVRAVAHLRLAGPRCKSCSEALRPFVAGSWSQVEYEQDVLAALLHKTKICHSGSSVDFHLGTAERLVLEALEVLVEAEFTWAGNVEDFKDA